MDILFLRAWFHFERLKKVGETLLPPKSEFDDVWGNSTAQRQPSSLSSSSECIDLLIITSSFKEGADNRHLPCICMKHTRSCLVYSLIVKIEALHSFETSIFFFLAEFTCKLHQEVWQATGCSSLL